MALIYIPIISYVALNPLLVTDASDLNIIKRLLLVETTLKGERIPQNFPRDGALTDVPLCRLT